MKKPGAGQNKILDAHKCLLAFCVSKHFTDQRMNPMLSSFEIIITSRAPIKAKSMEIHYIDFAWPTRHVHLNRFLGFLVIVTGIWQTQQPIGQFTISYLSSIFWVLGAPRN